MLRLILVVNLLTSPAYAFFGTTLKSEEECVALIKKKYDRSSQKIYNLRHVITGNGKYATHFYYDITYKTNAKVKDQSCVARIYCTDYDYEIYEEYKKCGR